VFPPRAGGGAGGGPLGGAPGGGAGGGTSPPGGGGGGGGISPPACGTGGGRGVERGAHTSYSPPMPVTERSKVTLADSPARGGEGGARIVRGNLRRRDDVIRAPRVPGRWVRNIPGGARRSLHPATLWSRRRRARERGARVRTSVPQLLWHQGPEMWRAARPAPLDFGERRCRRASD